MRIIQNCNTSIVKILREMLDKMRQKEINRITELIFLIIKQRIFHSKREVNTEFLLTTIDIVLISNHIIEVRKIKMTKKILKKNEYDVEHLRLRRIMKKIIVLENENEEKKRMNIRTMKKAMKKMRIQNKKKNTKNICDLKKRAKKSLTKSLKKRTSSKKRSLKN